MGEDFDVYDAICVIDTENDTYKELFAAKSTNPDIRNWLHLYFIHDDKLYFLLTQDERTVSDNGEIQTKSTSSYMTLDIKTNKVATVENKYSSQEYGHIVFANDKYIFFCDDYNGRLFATDKNFKNEQTIINYGKDYTRNSLFYDKDTDELYIGICSKSMVGLPQANDLQEGYICCINGNLECRKIEMPSDEITDFRLTKKYIYYTIYGPISYGTSPRGGRSVDETGNKIYRVSRNNTAAGELIFDGHETIFFNLGYIVVGDYLYIDYVSLVTEGSMTWFRLTGITARISITKGTIKWLYLD